jgi:hypothetical protein
MDTLKGHVESIETVFGEAIVSRDESLVVLAQMPGLGPPDLCWLQKAGKSALTGASSEAQGYYHYCLGIDVSSSAAVAAYFANITSLVEPISFLGGFFTSVETKIERGFFCTYDPFTRLDVRCELCIPGGVVCGALDSDGNVHDVTPDLWRNVTVSAAARRGGGRTGAALAAAAWEDCRPVAPVCSACVPGPHAWLMTRPAFDALPSILTTSQCTSATMCTCSHESCPADCTYGEHALWVAAAHHPPGAGPPCPPPHPTPHPPTHPPRWRRSCAVSCTTQSWLRTRHPSQGVAAPAWHAWQQWGAMM